MLGNNSSRGKCNFLDTATSTVDGVYRAGHHDGVRAVGVEPGQTELAGDFGRRRRGPGDQIDQKCVACSTGGFPGRPFAHQRKRNGRG